MNPILLFIFTKLASILGLLGAIAIIILWLLLHGQHETSFILLCITLGLTTTVTLLKKVFKVPRPTSATLTLSSYSFPSGHAACATFLAMVLVILARNLTPLLWYLIVFICSLTAFSISYSRLLLKVHTLFQVSVGVSLGLLFGWVFTALL